MKKLLKYFFYKLYELGYREARSRNLNKVKLQRSQAAIFDDTVIIKDAVLENYRGNNEYIKIGPYSVIQGYLLLFRHGGNICIGKNCFVGQGTRIWSAKNIQIGDRVLISHNVNIHDNISHPMDAAERHEDFMHIFFKGGFKQQQDLKEEDVIIEDDAWVGFNAVILKGVRIGKGAIIGAGSVITKDVPDHAVVVGNPQRIIRYNEPAV